MKILIKAMAGSHLFGTSTPSSDKDYKGVFLPTADEILLGSYSESIQQTTGDSLSKNTSEDIDMELYSLKKFLKMLSNGDTAALELLFTPDDMIIEKDPIWDEIISIKDQLISSKVNAMIGYARQQANKYGIKGSRMGELNNVIEVLKKYERILDFPDSKLKHAWGSLLVDLKGMEHVHQITLSAKHEGGEEVPALDILGKRFDYHNKFHHVLKILSDVYKNYGQRAREAKKNNGVDFKALSHAVRVSLQGIELLSTGKITLPLSSEHVKLVKDIKMGNIPYVKVQPILEDLLLKLESAKSESTIIDKLDQDFLDSLLIKYHRRVLNGLPAREITETR